MIPIQEPIKTYPGPIAAGIPLSTVFKFIDNTHVKARINHADNTYTELVYNTNYTVIGEGESTGSVTLVIGTSVVDGDTLVIYMEVPLEQTREYKRVERFPSNLTEKILDQIVLALQQQKEQLQRSLLLPLGSDITNIILTEPEEGKSLKWDSNNNLINTDNNIDEVADACLAAQTAAELAETGAELAQAGAELAETNAEAAQTAAQTAEDKAEKWAEEDEDVEVEPDQYSAKHWATKTYESLSDLNDNITTINGRLALDYPFYGINITNYPVCYSNRVNSKDYERLIYLFGDSHGWGQGSPDYDGVINTTNGSTTGGAGKYTAHSSFQYNKGFFQRIQKHIEDKLDFYTKSVNFFGTGTNGQRDVFEVEKVDTAQKYQKINPFCGYFLQAASAISDPANITTSNVSGFYTASALSDVTYSGWQYKDNVYRNKFGWGLMALAKDAVWQTNPFLENNYATMIPNHRIPSSGGTWVTMFYNTTGYMGEQNSADNMLYLHFQESLPKWLLTTGNIIYLEGYGELKVHSYFKLSSSYGGYNIRFVKPDDTAPPAGFSKYIYPGLKLYKSRVGTGAFYIDTEQPVRRIYVGVESNQYSAKMGVYFVDNVTATAFANPIDNGSSVDYSNVFYLDTAGYPKVYKVTGENWTDITSDASVVITSSKITIDTYQNDAPNSSASEQVIYCIDFGKKQMGRLCFSHEGQNAAALNVPNAGSATVQFRGVLFDLNEVRNWAMGGHRVCEWLGEDASYSDPARDHVADILKYTPITPSLLIVQIPFVNEYLAQTPLADFKVDLALLVSRLNNHKNAAMTRKMDVLLFNTLGHKSIEFEGGASSAIDYDDYTTAAKEVAADNNWGFVDCRQILKSRVSFGLEDYNELFWDNTHPSGVANELIAGYVIDALDRVLS